MITNTKYLVHQCMKKIKIETRDFPNIFEILFSIFTNVRYSDLIDYGTIYKFEKKIIS